MDLFLYAALAVGVVLVGRWCLRMIVEEQRQIAFRRRFDDFIKHFKGER